MGLLSVDLRRPVCVWTEESTQATRY